MYRPSAFREDRIEILHQAIVAYPLAMLVTSGACGISANLIPFTLHSDAGERGVLKAHLAKANSQLADLHQIASTKLAVDCQIKEGPIPDPPMLVEKEADRPYLPGLERSLRADLTPSVPRHPLASSGIKF